MRWVWAGIAVVGLLVATLFTVQNSARTTQLSFDLGFAAWQLERPVAIPALIGGCVLVGILLGAVPMWLRSARLAGRVRELEAKDALGSAMGTSPRPSDARDPGAW